MEMPAAGHSRAMVLGSLTIPGRPEQVGLARGFVARALATNQVSADVDAATLLTSEIVTNAVQHTRSGTDGGTVTIVVIAVARGVLVEIIDDGAASAPVVKGDLYAAEGHGLFLVQNMVTEWGYQRDEAGTTVWFHLPVTHQSGPPDSGQDPPDDQARPVPAAAGPDPDAPPARPARFWAAATQSAASARLPSSRPGLAG